MSEQSISRAGTLGRSPIRAAVTALVAGSPLVLALVAEAAWIAVVATLIQEYQLRMVVLDLPVVASFVVLGWLATRFIGRRIGTHWPSAAVALTLASAIAGVLLAPAARLHLTSGVDGFAPALGANPGGLLAGLAVLRGVGWGTARLPLSEDRLARLLSGGLIAISVTAVLGALPSDPLRDRLLADVLGQGLLFVACATVALALTRQTIAAGEVGAAWQRNPIWLVTLLVMVGLFVTLAAGSVGQVERALEVLIVLVIVPLAIAGPIVGWTRRTLRIAVLLVVVAAVTLAALGMGARQTQQQSGGTPNGVGIPAAPLDGAAAGGVAILVALILAIIVLLLVRQWMRQLPPRNEDVIEERFVDRSPAEPRLGPHTRWRPSGHPADAVAAYRRLLLDIAQRHGVRREPWETPHEHAARLREGSSGNLALDLLAADYALASFGGVPLSAGENGRAVRRWRALRRQLRTVVGRDRAAFGDDLADSGIPPAHELRR